MPANSETASALRRAGGAIAIALDAIGVVSSVAVVGLIFFLVIARYVLGLSVVGLHELIKLAAVALYMNGAVIASRRREAMTAPFM
ncbi:MAG: hypothetical protein K8F31_05960 [Roseovarius sp.]|nr:hypothetical protein [Roseovarius sp.]